MLEVPERPAYEVKTHEGTLHYSLKGEQEESKSDAEVTFSPAAYLAHSEWLREVLARFNANRCALKAVNQQDDPGCNAP